MRHISIITLIVSIILVLISSILLIISLSQPKVQPLPADIYTEACKRDVVQTCIDDDRNGKLKCDGQTPYCTVESCSKQRLIKCKYINKDTVNLEFVDSKQIKNKKSSLKQDIYTDICKKSIANKCNTFWYDSYSSFDQCFTDRVSICEFINKDTINREMVKDQVGPDSKVYKDLDNK